MPTSFSINKEHIIINHLLLFRNILMQRLTTLFSLDNNINGDSLNKSYVHSSETWLQQWPFFKVWVFHIETSDPATYGIWEHRKHIRLADLMNQRYLIHFNRKRKVCKWIIINIFQKALKIWILFVVFHNIFLLKFWIYYK